MSTSSATYQGPWPRAGTIAETIDRAAAEVFDSEDEVAANDGLDLMTARRGRRGLAQ
jgi:hypothetical protein